MSSSSSSSSSSPSSSSCINESVDLTTRFRYCILQFYGVKRRAAWPVELSESGDTDAFLRLVADTCEISHGSIKYITLKEVSKIKNRGDDSVHVLSSSSSTSSSSHETRAYRVADNGGTAITIGSVLGGMHKSCVVCFDDSSIQSDSSFNSSSYGTNSTTRRGLERFKPYASELFYLLGRRQQTASGSSIIRGTPRAASGRSLYDSIVAYFRPSPNNLNHRHDDYNHIGEDIDGESSDLIKKMGDRRYNDNDDDDNEGKKKNRFYDFKQEESSLLDDGVEISTEQAAEVSDEEFSGSANREQLLKFKRIQSHLVNERTVLAWLRLCLAFISLSFKFKTLSFDYYEEAGYSLSTFLYLIGGFYVLMLPFTWYSGYDRYRRCQAMLQLKMRGLSQYFYKMGFDADIASIAMVLLLSFIGVVVGGSTIIWSTPY